MGITDAVSGNDVQRQQAIDAVPGSQQPLSAQSPAAGIRGILKASSSQSSTEARGFTETRVVLKADSGTVVGCETELIEKHEFQSGSKTIPQRDVSQTDCKEICLGKKPEKTIEAIGGGICIALIGLGLLFIAGSGVMSSQSNSALSANASLYNSTSPLNLTIDKNMAEVLHNVTSAASNQDDSGSGAVSGAGVLLIAWAIFGVLLTRFCQGNNKKKTGDDQDIEKQNLEAGSLAGSSQQSDSAYGSRQTLSSVSGSEYGFECESVIEPICSRKQKTSLSGKQKKNSRPVAKMSPIKEEVAGPSGLCSIAISTKKPDTISMEDLSTPEQKIAANQNTKLQLKIAGYSKEADSYDVETGCFTKAAGYPVSAEYASSDESEEDESSPFLPSLVRVEVEVMPPAFASECFEMVNMSAKEGGASAQLMEGEYVDEAAVIPFEGSYADRLSHFIENNAFESLEPALSKKFKILYSKMSKVDFQKFAEHVKAGDKVAVRQSINKMVTCKFPHFSHEKRERLVQTFAEVINTFPVSPPVEVVVKDTAG